jgi:hypothetical protein
MSPRKTPSITNVEAQLPPDLWQLYSALVDAGPDGLTLEQIAPILGLCKQSVSDKLWKLSDLGRAEKSPHRRITSRGAPAPVWVAVGAR